MRLLHLFQPFEHHLLGIAPDCMHWHWQDPRDQGYLRNWPLGLDLQIIARTIRLVFFDRTVY